MKAFELLARLKHTTLTQGTFGDTDLFIGTEKQWALVAKEIEEYG